MDPNKNCLYFAGGKKLQLDSTNEQSVFKISKNTDGTVTLELKLTINKEEANKAVFNFSELNGTEGEIGAKNPNMVYLEAYENAQAPKQISVFDGNLKLMYDKGVFSELSMNLVIADSGKTDHAKTDHPAVGG